MDKPKKQTGGAVSEISKANLDPKNRLGKREATQVTPLRLPKSLVAKVKRKAKAQRTNFNAYVRSLLETAVEE